MIKEILDDENLSGKRYWKSLDDLADTQALSLGSKESSPKELVCLKVSSVVAS